MPDLTPLPTDWQQRLARVLRTVFPPDPADRAVVEAFLERLNLPTQKETRP